MGKKIRYFRIYLLYAHIPERNVFQARNKETTDVGANAISQQRFIIQRFWPVLRLLRTNLGESFFFFFMCTRVLASLNV